jgi:hypothetical protein
MLLDVNMERMISEDVGVNGQNQDLIAHFAQPLSNANIPGSGMKHIYIVPKNYGSAWLKGPQLSRIVALHASFVIC